VISLVRVESGSGITNVAKVGSNLRLWIDAVQKTAENEAIDNGDGYNLNTGQIVLSATTAVMYVKNNEDKSLFISSIAIGIGTGSFSDNVEIFIVRNPTAGTMITAGISIDQNANRDFGSAKTLTADAFKGASGETFTDGTDTILIAQNGQGRVFANINMVLQKGNSIGVRINPNLSSGSVEAYAALICHLETET